MLMLADVSFTPPLDCHSPMPPIIAFLPLPALAHADYFAAAIAARHIFAFRFSIRQPAIFFADFSLLFRCRHAAILSLTPAIFTLLIYAITIPLAAELLPIFSLFHAFFRFIIATLLSRCRC